MTNCTPEYEYKQVNSRDLSVDPLYQRDLDNGKISKIVREFNPYLVNAIKCSYRDGKLFIFDGQHTVQALKAKRGGRDCIVECKVFYGLTRLDEMELFIAQNGAATGVKTREKFRALWNNGDPDIKGMVRDVEFVGLICDFKNSKIKNRIVAVSSLFKAYKTLDEDEFRDMLMIVRDAWDGDPESLRAEILDGMTRFYRAYGGDFNRKHLVKALSRVNPTALIRDAKAIQTAGAAKYARVILGIYNKGRTTGRLEERF